MEKLKVIVLFIFGLLFIGLVLSFADYRTEKLMGWAEVYEVCVEVEYGVTPTVFYNSNGHYPECDTSKYQEKMEL